MDGAGADGVVVRLEPPPDHRVDHVPEEDASVLRPREDVGVRTRESALDLEAPVAVAGVRGQNAAVRLVQQDQGIRHAGAENGGPVPRQGET